jgi:hypothetical protein
LVLGSVAAVFAAVACVEPNHVALADPQAGAGFTYPFPAPLQGQINRLDAAGQKEHPPGPNAKKALILHTAFAELIPQPPQFTSSATMQGLTHLKDYHFDTSKKTSDPKYFPDYFENPFGNKQHVTVNPISGHYDYKASKQLWVDFANHILGGGVFGDGMVQEETMALSMPQLADAAALGYKTRTDGKAGPLNSDPTPLLLKNIQRSIAIDGSLYRDGWRSQTVDQINAHLTPMKPNQNVNVLAIAVEKLDNPQVQQKALDTIDDLFNTFVAGYTLANDAMPGATINTGPIGTGDFRNDEEVIYVMQKLAWQQIGGITVNYWGLNNSDKQNYDNMVDRIIANWNTAQNKKVSHLMLIAQECLTGAKACT